MVRYAPPLTADVGSPGAIRRELSRAAVALNPVQVSRVRAAPAATLRGDQSVLRVADMFERGTVEVTPDGANVSVSGLPEPPIGFDGTVTLVNRSGVFQLRLEHNSTLVDLRELLFLPNGERLTLQPHACVTMRYSRLLGRWYVVSHSAYPDDRTAINWEGTQNFIGATNFSGPASFSNTLTANGTVSLNAGTTINSTLTVNASTNFNSSVSFGTTASVGFSSGSTTTWGSGATIQVNSGANVTFDSPVLFTGQIDFDADVDFNSSSSFRGVNTWLSGSTFQVNSGATFNVATPSTFSGTLNSTTQLNANNLTVTGNTIFGSGSTNFNGVVDFNDRVDLNDDLVSFGNITHATGNAIFSGSLFRVDAGTDAVIEGPFDVAHEFAITGVQTLTTGSSQNNVTINAGTTILRVRPTANIELRGFTGGYLGRKLRVMNDNDTGGFTVTVVRNSGSATAGNKFLKGSGDVVLSRHDILDMAYDDDVAVADGAYWKMTGGSVL